MNDLHISSATFLFLALLAKIYYTLINSVVSLNKNNSPTFINNFIYHIPYIAGLELIPDVASEAPHFIPILALESETSSRLFSKIFIALFYTKSTSL